MAAYVYLIKKKNAYMIGQAKNIEKEMNKIRPDELVTSLIVDHPQAFEARLLRRYRNTRLPGSFYFQFSNNQLVDCKKQFELKSSIPKSLGEEFFIALTASILIFICISIFLFYIRLSFYLNIFISLILFSLPMWLLFFLGNFGGYNNTDLRIFSSWFNRIRAFILASTCTFMAYIVFRYLLI